MKSVIVGSITDLYVTSGTTCMIAPPIRSFIIPFGFLPLGGGITKHESRSNMQKPAKNQDGTFFSVCEQKP